MSIIQNINNFFETEQEGTLSILRLDLPDPISGGNKLFKMKYNLEEMERRGFHRALTFGGAFSNHIAAVANAGKKNGLETIGIIRGDELTADSNDVLAFAASCGMQLVFVSRDEYRKRYDATYCEKLLEQYGPAYLIPEGGANAFGVKGCKEILSEKTGKFDTIICPVGTGATLAGIISSAKKHQKIIGVAVLNGRNYLEKEVEKYLQDEPVVAKWEIVHDFTLGGYGKSSAELEKFRIEMKNNFNLPLDHVYAGKTLFAISQMKKGNLLHGKNLLFVHTGGYAFCK